MLLAFLFISSLQPVVQRTIFHMAQGEFSADGRLFLSYDNAPNQLTLWDARQARIIRQPLTTKQFTWAHFGADNRGVYFDQGAEIWRYDPLTQAASKTSLPGAAQGNVAIFGARALLWNGKLAVYDLKTEQKLHDVPYEMPVSVGVKLLVSPDGKTAIAKASYREMLVMELPSGRALWRLPMSGPFHARFVGNESVIVGLDKQELRLHDLRTGAVKARRAVEGDFISGIDASKTLVAYTLANMPDRRIYLLDAASLAPLGDIARDREQMTVVFSPDGRLIAGGQLHFLSTSGRVVAETPRRTLHTPNGMLVTEDGRYIVLWLQGGELHVVDLSTGELVLAHAGVTHAPSLSQNGKFLLVHAKDRTRVLDTKAWTQVHDFPSLALAGWSAHCDDAGEHIVDARARVWKRGKLYKEIRVGEEHAPPLITRDGKTLLTTSKDGLLKMDVQSGVVTRIPVPGASPYTWKQAWISGQYVAFNSKGLITFEAGKARFSPFDKEYSSTAISLQWNPKAKRMAIVFDKELWDVEWPSLKVLSKRSIALDHNGATSVVDPLGVYLFTPNQAEVELRDLETLAVKVRHVARSRTERGWVTDTYYTVTKPLLPSLHFVDDVLRVIPFESFDLLYHRPDLVLQQIGRPNADAVQMFERAWKKRVDKAGFSPEQLRPDSVLPEVSLVSAEPPAETTEPVLKWKLATKDAVSLRVLVNEVPTPAVLGEDVVIPLTSGINRIAISVRDKRGLESPALLYTVSFVGNAPPSRLIAVAVGVSKYQQRDMDLLYAAKDAQDLAAKLGARGGTTTLLLDEAATRAGVLALKQQLMKTTVHDRVVLFFAGHGLLSDKLDYFFATHDVQLDALERSGVSYDEIEGLLDHIPARNKVLLMDTCHSGELDDAEKAALQLVEQPPGVKLAARAVRGLKRRPGAPKSSDVLRGLFADLQRGSGTVVIASSGGAELALESDTLKNGVFTFALLELLAGEGQVSVSKLERELAERVQKLTAGAQRPSARREFVSADFSL